jgi:hypothetical protein
MLCDLVAMKSNKLWILQLFWKSVHKNELSRTKFYGFQAKWASYGHSYGIVCSTDPILCICVYLGMTNNVDLGSFNFRCTKNSFFIFLVQKLSFLWSVYQKFATKIEQLNFKWYYIIFDPQFTSCLHVKSYITTHQKKTNICRFSWKRDKFELQVLHSLLMFFFQKSFWGTQVSISLEIHQVFGKILSQPRSSHAHRFGRILKSA